MITSVCWAVTSLWGVEFTGVTEPPTMPGTVFHTQSDPAQSANSAEAEKPWKNIRLYIDSCDS